MKKSMNNRQEYKIFAIVFIAFAFVAATGVMAYMNLSKVVNNITKASSPGLKLLLLESLTSHLSHAESSVKSYNLTRDPQYIHAYTDLLSEVYVILDSIQSNMKPDEQEKILGDSLALLVDEKRDVLESILQLRNNEVVTEELRRINDKLKIADQVNKKVNKSGKLFKSKAERERIKKEKEAARAENVLAKLKNELGSEISGVRQEQLYQLKDIKLQEFDLLRRDEQIMVSARSVIFRLQEIEKQQMVQETLDASEQAAKTYRVIALFCLLATLLMLATAYVIISYIGKSKRSAETLKKANIEIERFARAKESFLYNVSHELRTPLNAVIGFSDQLNRYHIEGKPGEIAGIIYKSAGHLQQVLNDILDISKLNAGKFSFHSATFSLLRLMQEVEVIMQKNSRDKGLDFSLKVQPGVPAFLKGDVLRLRQILLNIIDNAIKYTLKGSVGVQVDFVPLSDQKGHLSVTVTDTGIGISEKDLQRIFNEFEQAATRVRVNVRGTGLGLSITRELIEHQGGEIQIRSKVDEGTTISFIIPYMIADENGLKDEEKVGEQYTGLWKGINILAVDDIRVNLRLLQHILQKHDVRLTTFEDGKAALEAVRENTYDLILLDINMEGMDGVELCRAIREMEVPKSSTPVVAVTADYTSFEAYTEIGFDDVLEKPYTEKMLLSILQRNLDYEGLASSEEYPASINLDDPANGHLRKELLNTICRGLAGMEQALNQGNAVELSEELHKLLPVCGFLQNNELKAGLRTVENKLKTGGSPENCRDELLQIFAVFHEAKERLSG